MSTAHLQFAALADPTRRAIFERLTRKPLPVGALAEALPISRPAVSQHLRVLQEARLVAFERVGTRNIYRIDVQGIVTLRKCLDAMWARALGDLKLEAESSYPASRKEKR